MRETGGAAAAVAKIFDGTSAAGVLLDTVGLVANESAREWYGGGPDVEPGILCEQGIFVDVSGTGVIEGSIRVLD